MNQLTSFQSNSVDFSVQDLQSQGDVIELPAGEYIILGEGANMLLSDEVTAQIIRYSGAGVSIQEDTKLITEAGTNWDKLVVASIQADLWGLERMSGIPGSVGAGIVGNIAAYGQAVKDTLEWVEAIDLASDDRQVQRIDAADLDFGYRTSNLANNHNSLLLVRACFNLSHTPTDKLEYESALKVAKELNSDLSNVKDVRDVILETRRRAGSLLDSDNTLKTAGSFFKNPMVDAETAEHVMQYEEREVTRQAILSQNKIHGGDTMRVSASHVLLAAGFNRGQSWGHVRLHPDHILKIENTGEATSQEIYEVAQEIMTTVKDKLGIDLEPEVRFYGNFS